MKALRLASSLAGIQPIEDVIHAIIGTAFVQGSIPISIMVVAPSGAGKSRTLIRFDDSDYIMRADDLTSSGLMDLLQNDKDNKIKYILIPDFNPVLSHKNSVSSLLMANLLSVTQDGTARILDGRNTKEVKHNPVGILTAVTFDMFARHSRKWNELGITRRILPLHYAYSLSTIRRAQEKIRKGQISGQSAPVSLSNLRLTTVEINNDFSHDIQSLSETLSLNLGQYIKTVQGMREPQQGKAILPMAPHLVLAAIAKGNAIRFGRNRVNKNDVEMVEEFVSFTDMINRRQL